MAQFNLFLLMGFLVTPYSDYVMSIFLFSYENELSGMFNKISNTTRIWNYTDTSLFYKGNESAAHNPYLNEQFHMFNCSGIITNVLFWSALILIVYKVLDFIIRKCFIEARKETDKIKILSFQFTVHDIKGFHSWLFWGFFYSNGLSVISTCLFYLITNMRLLIEKEISNNKGLIIVSFIFGLCVAIFYLVIIQIGFLVIHHLIKLGKHFCTESMEKRLAELKITKEEHFQLKYIVKNLLQPAKTSSSPNIGNSENLQINEKNRNENQKNENENGEIEIKQNHDQKESHDDVTKYDELATVFRDYNASLIGEEPSLWIRFPWYFIWRYSEASFTYSYLKEFF